MKNVERFWLNSGEHKNLRGTAIRVYICVMTCISLCRTARRNQRSVKAWCFHCCTAPHWIICQIRLTNHKCHGKENMSMGPKWFNWLFFPPHGRDRKISMDHHAAIYKIEWETLIRRNRLQSPSIGASLRPFRGWKAEPLSHKTSHNKPDLLCKNRPISTGPLYFIRRFHVVTLWLCFSRYRSTYQK